MLPTRHRQVVISSRQLFPNRDDSQITKPTNQGSYDYYHRYQEPRPVLQLLPEASLPSCFAGGGRRHSAGYYFLLAYYNYSLLFNIFTSVGSPSFPAVYRNK